MPIAQTIDNLLFTATQGLFKAYGQPLTELSAPFGPVSAPLCAVIGFQGEALAGTLMIAADREPIQATRPAASTDRDWIAELANQLLGRFKNRLLAYGMEVHSTTPIVIRGERITPLGSNGGLPGVVFRCAAGGQVTVWIDHHTIDGLQLQRLADPEPVAREGDVLLF